MQNYWNNHLHTKDCNPHLFVAHHLKFTLNSPTTDGSSLSSDFPLYNLNVSQKSVKLLNSGTFSNSQSYTLKKKKV